MTDEIAKLRCPACFHEASLPLKSLPLPSTIATCPKCISKLPIYYFMNRSMFVAASPIAVQAIDILEREYLLLISDLNCVKPRYDWRCPLCNIKLVADINHNNLKEFTIETRFREKRICLSKQECHFCKTKMAIFVKHNGELDVVDIDFDTKDHELRSEISQLNIDIQAAQNVFENSESEKTIQAAENKIGQLENKLDLMEQRYEDFELRYQDKRRRWKYKAIEKYGE